MHLSGGNEPLLGFYGGYLFSGALEEAHEWLLTGRMVCSGWAASGPWVAFRGQQLGGAVPCGHRLGRRELVPGTHFLPCLPSFTNPEPEPLPGGLPRLESPLPLACLPGTTGFSPRTEELTSGARLCRNGWGWGSAARNVSLACARPWVPCPALKKPSRVHTYNRSP